MSLIKRTSIYICFIKKIMDESAQNLVTVVFERPLLKATRPFTSKLFPFMIN